jgi:hypothetical protein
MFQPSGKFDKSSEVIFLYQQNELVFSNPSAGKGANAVFSLAGKQLIYTFFPPEETLVSTIWDTAELS